MAARISDSTRCCMPATDILLQHQARTSLHTDACLASCAYMPAASQQSNIIRDLKLASLYRQSLPCPAQTTTGKSLPQETPLSARLPCAHMPTMTSAVGRTTAEAEAALAATRSDGPPCPQQLHQDLRLLHSLRLGHCAGLVLVGSGRGQVCNRAHDCVRACKGCVGTHAARPSSFPGSGKLCKQACHVSRL